MKKITALVSTFLVAVSALALDMQLAWEANPPEDMIEGYSFYVQAGETPAVKVATVLPSANPTFTLTLQATAVPTIYRVYVKAFNIWGESDESNALRFPSKIPTPPRGLRVARHADGSLTITWDAQPGTKLESSQEVSGPWSWLSDRPIVMDTADANRFFRLASG